MKVWNLGESIIILLIVGLLSLVANSVPGKVGVIEAIPGLLILIAIAIAGISAGSYSGSCLCNDTGLHSDDSWSALC